MFPTFLLSALLHKPIERQPIDFSFFGCNRLGDDDEKAQFAVNKSSANVPELQANFRDINATSSVLCFAVGDLVNGYADDQGDHLKMQLDAWMTQVNLDPIKVTLVTTSGNHEMNRKHPKVKVSSPYTDAVWIDWLKRSGLDKYAGNGPTPSSDPDDHLVGDNSLLNYSFTVGTTHFVMLDTDTRTTETQPGSTEPKISWVPAKWIADDLAKAESDPNISDVFVLGHRNLVDPTDATEDAPIDADCSAKVIAAFGKSTKVRAYLCAHVHAYDLQKIKGTNAYQVIVGNAGSPLAKEWKPDQKWFGFGEVLVHADGKVGLILHKRPAPDVTRPFGDNVPVSSTEPEITLG